MEDLLKREKIIVLLVFLPLIIKAVSGKHVKYRRPAFASLKSRNVAYDHTSSSSSVHGHNINATLTKSRHLKHSIQGKEIEERRQSNVQKGKRHKHKHKINTNYTAKDYINKPSDWEQMSHLSNLLGITGSFVPSKEHQFIHDENAHPFDDADDGRNHNNDAYLHHNHAYHHQYQETFPIENTHASNYDANSKSKMGAFPILGNQPPPVDYIHYPAVYMPHKAKDTSNVMDARGRNSVENKVRPYSISGDAIYKDSRSKDKGEPTKQLISSYSPRQAMYADEKPKHLLSLYSPKKAMYEEAKPKQFIPFLNSQLVPSPQRRINNIRNMYSNVIGDQYTTALEQTIGYNSDITGVGVGTATTGEHGLPYIPETIAQRRTPINLNHELINNMQLDPTWDKVAESIPMNGLQKEMLPPFNMAIGKPYLPDRSTDSFRQQQRLMYKGLGNSENDQWNQHEGQWNHHGGQWPNYHEGQLNHHQGYNFQGALDANNQMPSNAGASSMYGGGDVRMSQPGDSVSDSFGPVGESSNQAIYDNSAYLANHKQTRRKGSNGNTESFPLNFATPNIKDNSGPRITEGLPTDDQYDASSIKSHPNVIGRTHERVSTLLSKQLQEERDSGNVANVKVDPEQRTATTFLPIEDKYDASNIESNAKMASRKPARVTAAVSNQHQEETSSGNAQDEQKPVSSMQTSALSMNGGSDVNNGANTDTHGLAEELSHPVINYNSASPNNKVNSKTSLHSLKVAPSNNMDGSNSLQRISAVLPIEDKYSASNIELNPMMTGGNVGRATNVLSKQPHEETDAVTANVKVSSGERTTAALPIEDKDGASKTESKPKMTGKKLAAVLSHYLQEEADPGNNFNVKVNPGQRIVAALPFDNKDDASNGEFSLTMTGKNAERATTVLSKEPDEFTNPGTAAPKDKLVSQQKVADAPPIDDAPNIERYIYTKMTGRTPGRVINLHLKSPQTETDPGSDQDTNIPMLSNTGALSTYDGDGVRTSETGDNENTDATGLAGSSLNTGTYGKLVDVTDPETKGKDSNSNAGLQSLKGANNNVKVSPAQKMASHLLIKVKDDAELNTKVEERKPERVISGTSKQLQEERDSGNTGKVTAFPEQRIAAAAVPIKHAEDTPNVESNSQIIGRQPESVTASLFKQPQEETVPEEAVKVKDASGQRILGALLSKDKDIAPKLEANLKNAARKLERVQSVLSKQARDEKVASGQRIESILPTENKDGASNIKLNPNINARKPEGISAVLLKQLQKLTNAGKNFNVKVAERLAAVLPIAGKHDTSDIESNSEMAGRKLEPAKDVLSKQMEEQTDSRNDQSNKADNEHNPRNNDDLTDNRKEKVKQNKGKAGHTNVQAKQDGKSGDDITHKFVNFLNDVAGHLNVDRLAIAEALVKDVEKKKDGKKEDNSQQQDNSKQEENYKLEDNSKQDDISKKENITQKADSPHKEDNFKQISFANSATDGTEKQLMRKPTSQGNVNSKVLPFKSKYESITKSINTILKESPEVKVRTSQPAALGSANELIENVKSPILINYP